MRLRCWINIFRSSKAGRVIFLYCLIEKDGGEIVNQTLLAGMVLNTHGGRDGSLFKVTQLIIKTAGPIFRGKAQKGSRYKSVVLSTSSGLNRYVHTCC